LNQPAYTVSYMVDGRPQLTMPVIVGKKSNQTYFFTDKIKAVENNPDWGVPRSIIVNEMIPKLIRDPSYLDRLGYEVMTSSGRRVSSRSVDWRRVAYNKSSVDVRQPPGPRNALGQLKIVFPNKHAIYLHDTPQKALFAEKHRALSHGCVRLEDPKAMAAAVLGSDVNHVAARIAEGQSASEEVEGDVPVYLTYFTAWPDADGNVHYFDDVYDRDEHLSKAIERTKLARRAL
jgi:murein L,D-transpeptidase YcbB/YkuD